MSSFSMLLALCALTTPSFAPPLSAPPSFAPPSFAPPSFTIDPQQAARAFAEAADASERDGGQLWGTPLYGRMLFLDPAAGTMVANQAPADGSLTEVDGVFVGPLSGDLGIANTAQSWQGELWTTVIWPLPEASRDRVRLLSHEMVHRIQPALGRCAFSASPNAHLDTGTGRVWLRLEWRALAAALRAGTEDARRTALTDALAFRSARQAIYPEAHEAEAALESNEGVCEYTGYMLSCELEAERVEAVAARLLRDENADRHARGFAYASGPACGVLLDLADAARADGTSWRDGFSGTVDFGARLADAWDITLPDDVLTFAKTRLLPYDGEQVLQEESSRERARQARLARYQERFVDGPLLIAPASATVNYTFNPYGEESMPGHGQVYETLTVTDAWGKLEVYAGGGLLVRGDDGRLASVRVPKSAGVSPETATDAAPDAAPEVAPGRLLTGDGWTLQLADGWALSAGARDGDLTLVLR